MTIFPGLDASGNSNNWTENNINNTDSTATTYDIMTDVPTLTDEDTANFATLNPLIAAGSVTLSLANLKSTAGTNAQRSNVSTITVSSGEYYWETTWNTVGANDAAMTGIIGVDNLDPDSNFGSTNSYAYVQDGGKQGAGSYTGGYGDRYVAGDVIGTALDLDAGTITFYRNGTTQGTAFTGLPSVAYYLGCSFYNSGDNFDINFGQRPFAYTPPAGYLKLNTFNLPDSSIVDGSKNFVPVTYTGNGTSQSITGVNFQPDFTWIKQRSSTEWHILSDVIRGTDKQVFSNSTDAEQTNSTFLTSYNTDGFTVGTSTGTNGSGSTYVAWSWKAGGTAVSIAAGSIDGTNPTIASSVSANTTAGFSVVTYTGVTATSTIGHGLGVAPKFIITKLRNLSDGWYCYHESIGNNKFIRLDTTGAPTTSTIFGNTSPTSTVFTNEINNYTCVAYCFAEVEGFSKIGSYTGNGSTDGPFVYTGFSPAFVLMKRSDSTGDWRILDTARDPYNLSSHVLYPNDSGAEYTGQDYLNITASGFQLVNSAVAVNASGGTYIYMAFAENPFKNSLAR